MNNVLEYLESAALVCPDKTAISDRDTALSYAALRERAMAYGAMLRERVTAGCPIGVIADRDAETLPLFLGALYAGCFYVPIDPDMPGEKMRAILDDCACPCVLGRQKDRELLAALSYEGEFLTAEDAAPGASCPVPSCGPDAPAYMIYTSGSTGKPKGVLKSHGAVISFIEAYTATFSFSEEDVIGNQTPFFFDASAKDIYLLLKVRASMVIIPTELFMMPPSLIEYMNEKRVSFISWVPTALSIVAQLNTFSYIKPTTLRKVFFIGEVMPMKYLNRWRDALPELQYVNLYGQSELAGACCWYEVKKRFADDEVLPMGRTLPNCRIVLLDGETVVTEPDHIGEIYLISPALAAAYYNDPEKTAACFPVRDFGDGVPVRCFKSGDLARYDAEGNLVFASRTDFQIKHMGHRIELGEIEAVAGALPAIRRCCCLYDREHSRIVLFCELTEDLNGRQIQSLLRPRLSSYMLPSRVKILERLPLNPNGKIDRALLAGKLS